MTLISFAYFWRLKLLCANSAVQVAKSDECCLIFESDPDRSDACLLRPGICSCNHIHAVGDPTAVAEIKLSQIAVQMLLLAVLINVLHATLEVSNIISPKKGPDRPGPFLKIDVSDSYSADRCPAVRI